MAIPTFSSAPSDMALVMSAALFAEERHRGQVRKYTNEPYIIHPMNVARMVGLHTHDPHVVCAAILHDVLEDTDTTSHEIIEKFGIRVNEMVVALTDVPKSAGNRKTRKEMDRTRVLNASPDVHMIKIYDIIDNWETISKFDPNFSILFHREVHAFVDLISDLDPHHLMIFKSKVRLDNESK